MADTAPPPTPPPSSPAAPISPRAMETRAPLSAGRTPTVEEVWKLVADMHGSFARLEQSAALRLQQLADDARTQIARAADERGLASLRQVDASAATLPSLPFPGAPPMVSLRPDPETTETLRAIAMGMQRQPTPKDRRIERLFGLLERLVYVAALVLLERLIHGH